MLLLLLLPLCLLLSASGSSELCERGRWYDAGAAACRPCTACRGGEPYVVAPCSEFADTLCVDLLEIRGSVGRSIERGAARWRETEGPEELPRSAVLEGLQDRWGHAVMVVLCAALVFVCASVVLMVLRIYGRRRLENRKNIARARLFSRDRLNTTEYMNNLATMDRRLTADEIYEKRKKTAFEPHLLQENVYTDDVFVDLSGLPRNLPSKSRYDDQDHRSLLQSQDQQ